MAGPPQGVLERPLPFPSFVQSYSTLLPGLAGGQLVCGGRRTWESHPSEDLSELHRFCEGIAVQKYHYRQMRSWRDGLPKPLLDERVSLGTFRFGTFIDTGRAVQVVMARSPHRCPPSYGGSSADVIQLPDMAEWRFSRYNKPLGWLEKIVNLLLCHLKSAVVQVCNGNLHCHPRFSLNRSIFSRVLCI